MRRVGAGDGAYLRVDVMVCNTASEQSNPARNRECAWHGCQNTVQQANDILYSVAGRDDSPLCIDHLREASRLLMLIGWWRDRYEDEPEREPREGFVYFVRFADRVKIGFTTNPQQRLPNVPHDEVLAIQRGTLVDERRCHEAFAHLRERGEWFRAAPELLEFIAGLAASAEQTDPV